MRRSLCLVLFALTLSVVHAQEFNCTVSVIAPQIQSTPKRIWQSMETGIKIYKVLGRQPTQNVRKQLRFL